MAAFRLVVDPHVGFKVRHVGNNLLNRHTAGNTLTPRSGFEGAEDQILSPLGAATPEAVDQPIDFGLVRDQHVAHDAKTAGLPERDQPD